MAILWAVQAATEYGAATGEIASGQASGRSMTLDRFLERLFSADPVVVGGVVLAVLLIIALFRTRGYRG